MSVYDITSAHGKTMYALGLEHAVNMIEILGEDALENLKNKLAEAKKDAEQEAEACND